MNAMHELALDPFFDKWLSDEEWFTVADSDATVFKTTLELWSDYTRAIAESVSEHDLDSGEPFVVPSRYTRLTTVVMWLCGDRSRTEHDPAPIAEALRTFELFEDYVELEIDLRNDISDLGSDDYRLLTTDEFPMSWFDLERRFRSGIRLVDRVLFASIHNYQWIRRHGGRCQFASDVRIPTGEEIYQSLKAGQEEVGSVNVNNGSSAAVDSSSHEGNRTTDNGPAGFQEWGHNGTILKDVLTPLSWTFAAFLWERKSKWVSYDQLAEPVYNTPLDYVDHSSVRNLRTLVNKFFAENEIPWHIEAKKRQRIAQLAEGAPNNRNH